MKILCIGDTHWKDNLSYADYIKDRREGEKGEILDFLVKSAEDCEHVVFLGDFFNSKNNSSEVNRGAVELLERFGEKHVYIISGNHCKKGDGKTAIDFLGEVKKKNWHIFTHPGSIEAAGLKLDFLPYMLNSELGVETHLGAMNHIMEHLDGGDILFAHHLISGTTYRGMKAEMFNEVVLPQKELEKKYKLVVGGHIHEPQRHGNTLITGSLFTSEVGEIEKFIWKISATTKENADPDKIYVMGERGKWSFEIEKLKVPAREIHKLENPTIKQLSSIPKNAIVKVVITKKETDLEELKNQLLEFDAHLLVEDYPSERKKAHLEEGAAFDFSLEALLKLYAKEKGVDLAKLMKGLEIIS